MTYKPLKGSPDAFKLLHNSLDFSLEHIKDQLFLQIESDEKELDPDELFQISIEVNSLELEYSNHKQTICINISNLLLMGITISDSEVFEHNGETYMPIHFKLIYPVGNE